MLPCNVPFLLGNGHDLLENEGVWWRIDACISQELSKWQSFSYCGRTHYGGDATAAEEPIDNSEAPPPRPTKRGRRGAFLVEARHDKALLNVPESCWASIVVGSAAAHAGLLGPMPLAVTAREAIDDLPEIVEAGDHTGSIPP